MSMDHALARAHRQDLFDTLAIDEWGFGSADAFLALSATQPDLDAIGALFCAEAGAPLLCCWLPADVGPHYTGPIDANGEFLTRQSLARHPMARYAGFVEIAFHQHSTLKRELVILPFKIQLVA